MIEIIEVDCQHWNMETSEIDVTDLVMSQTTSYVGNTTKQTLESTLPVGTIITVTNIRNGFKEQWQVARYEKDNAKWLCMVEEINPEDGFRPFIFSIYVAITEDIQNTIAQRKQHAAVYAKHGINHSVVIPQYIITAKVA